MTPPDFLFCFAMRFLGNWCSTTFRVGKNSFVPRAQCWPRAMSCSRAPGLLPTVCARPGVPLFVPSHSDPLPWNFVSARPAHFYGLKLSQTLLAGHLNRATFVFSSKVHLHVWCISGQMPRWGSYKWPCRQSVTNLNSFSLCFIQIGILVLQQ